jgi:hypothetical protein
VVMRTLTAATTGVPGLIFPPCPRPVSYLVLSILKSKCVLLCELAKPVQSARGAKYLSSSDLSLWLYKPH